MMKLAEERSAEFWRQWVRGEWMQAGKAGPIVDLAAQAFLACQFVQKNGPALFVDPAKKIRDDIEKVMAKAQILNAMAFRMKELKESAPQDWS